MGWFNHQLLKRSVVPELLTPAGATWSDCGDPCGRFRWWGRTTDNFQRNGQTNHGIFWMRHPRKKNGFDPQPASDLGSKKKGVLSVFGFQTFWNPILDAQQKTVEVSCRFGIWNDCCDLIKHQCWILVVLLEKERPNVKGPMDVLGWIFSTALRIQRTLQCKGPWTCFSQGCLGPQNL